MPFSKEHIEEFNKLGSLHLIVRRNLVYRNKGLLDFFQNLKENKIVVNHFPEGQPTLKDLMLWDFAKHLSSVLQAEVVLNVLDDWAYLFRDDLRQGDIKGHSLSAVSHFNALGFPPPTRIILSTRDVKLSYGRALSLAKLVSFAEAKTLLGLKNSSNIGEIFVASVLAAPFLNGEVEAAKSLFLGYKRERKLYEFVRKTAPRLRVPAPSMLLLRELPSLTGKEEDIGALPEAEVYAGEKLKTAKSKVMNAFTGGRATIKEQRELGGNPDICPVFKYLFYLLDPSDASLKDQWRRCRRGALLCGEHKKYLWDKMEEFLADHQSKTAGSVKSGRQD